MKNCPNCGKKNEDSANFCENCGSSIKQVPLKQKNIKKLFVVGIVLIILIALYLIVNSIPNSPHSDKNQETFVTGIYNQSGLYFEIPDGWKAKTGNSSYVAMAMKSDASIRLFVYKYDNESTADYVNVSESHYKYWGDNPTDSSYGKYQKITAYDNVEKKEVREYVFQSGNSIYVLEFTSDSFLISDFDQIDKIVNSFQID